METEKDNRAYKELANQDEIVKQETGIEEIATVMTAVQEDDTVNDGFQEDETGDDQEVLDGKSISRLVRLHEVFDTTRMSITGHTLYLTLALGIVLVGILWAAYA